MTIVFWRWKYGFEVLEKPPGPTLGRAPGFHYLEILEACEIATRN